MKRSKSVGGAVGLSVREATSDTLNNQSQFALMNAPSLVCIRVIELLLFPREVTPLQIIT
jgi:hypothetical protein